jgi:phage tail-like protein
MKPEASARLLPEVIRQGMGPGQLLDGLLASMAELHRPCEDILDRLQAICDPRAVPERLLPFLARWVRFDGLCDERAQRRGRHPGIEDAGHLRELIAIAAELAHARGTAVGLLRFLALATGITGYRIEEQVRDDQGAIRPFHLRLIAPAAARRQHELVLLVLRMAKPAHVTCDLLFA